MRIQFHGLYFLRNFTYFPVFLQRWKPVVSPCTTVRSVADPDTEPEMSPVDLGLALIIDSYPGMLLEIRCEHILWIYLCIYMNRVLDWNQTRTGKHPDLDTDLDPVQNRPDPQHFPVLKKILNVDIFIPTHG